MSFKKPKKSHIKRALITLLIVVASLQVYFLTVPPLFSTSCSTLLETSDGQLLGARIASDGQWRFPAPDSIPEKFEKCILEFEDRYFYRHPGVNPGSLARAMARNFKEGRVISGGSTLTMQVARLSRPGKPRTIGNKALEIIRALFIELRHSKKEILTLYATNAPFGGNVVGLEAASWR